MQEKVLYMEETGQTNAKKRSKGEKPLENGGGGLSHKNNYLVRKFSRHNDTQGTTP
jgi:hypothetical protein